MPKDLDNDVVWLGHASTKMTGCEYAITTTVCNKLALCGNAIHSGGRSHRHSRSHAQPLSCQYKIAIVHALSERVFLDSGFCQSLVDPSGMTFERDCDTAIR
jgi:hypothetical protein